MSEGKRVYFHTVLGDSNTCSRQRAEGDGMSHAAWLSGNWYHSADSTKDQRLNQTCLSAHCAVLNDRDTQHNSFHKC